MRVLQALLARQAQGELSQLAARAFGTCTAASAEVAVASSSSPFLRFSNPYPQSLDHTQLLSSIPDTQVWLQACWVVVGGRRDPLPARAGKQRRQGRGGAVSHRMEQ
jgi:hypothetical protein